MSVQTEAAKATIADAIRWALGSKVPNFAWRKDGGCDFSGTQTRKPLGFAEVTLVLDNSDGELPTEFSEVS